MVENNKHRIIAIDGPSSSGKGTLAKLVAKHFNYPYLNTGAIYRLIALRSIENDLEATLKKGDYSEFEKRIPDLIDDIKEEDLDNPKLFNEEIGKIASIIAKSQLLRKSIFNWQKYFIKNSCDTFNGCVLDGRDTTTVIAPNASYKFYVTADVEVRAQRRQTQLAKNNIKADYEKILAQLKQRDDNDINRKESPLKIADDAHVIDNGNLEIQEGLEKILGIIVQKS